MKMAAFLAAAALACGSAMAADTGTDHGQRVSNERSAQAADARGGNGLMDKTKRAFSRIGDKIRHTGERLGQKLGTDQDERGEHTRAMGAAGDDRAQVRDQGRRERMDDAYANWRSQHGKESR